MKRFLPLILALAGSVTAAPSSQVAWTADTLRQVQRGDPASGQKLAQDKGCLGCHGPEPAGTFPVLNGQLATYLYKQLKDYQGGQRANPIMTGFAQGLSDAEMIDLVAWYSRQPRPAAAPQPDNEVAETLVRRGDSKRLIVPCSACHGTDGMGQTIDVPALTGQNREYLAQTLRDYQSGTRANDVYGRMRRIARELGESEIDALAAHYAPRQP